MSLLSIGRIRFGYPLLALLAGLALLAHPLGGVYAASPPSADRTIRFTLINGVGLYGGFAGAETARDQRAWRRHVTTRSSDIGVIGDNSDNTRTVWSLRITLLGE